MTKEELVELLKELNVPLSESTPKDDEMEEEIRIHFWDYIWEDITSSGYNYNTNVTYQISIIAEKKLNEKGLFPTIQHEYLTEKRRVHSFFSLEVLENV